METMISGKKYFLFSALSHELKKIYRGEIYRFLGRLVFEYQGFQGWYQGLFSASFELKCNREIIICEDQLHIVGIAILKNDSEEKKICTLRVAEAYQRQGIGHNLVEMCMNQLNAEKPMITLHKSKLGQFEKLLSYYDFELEQTQRHYYGIFSTELVFNGLLPQRNFTFSRIELLDMERIYRCFATSGKRSFEDFVDACVWCWYNKGKISRSSISEA